MFVLSVIKRRSSGFTLAEVLITLGVIGIVAAMTIPTLIDNYQKTQYVTGLKKSYAEITEALRLMANDSGCPEDLKCTGIFGSTASTLGNGLKKYFKLAKDCGVNLDPNNENQKCMSDQISGNYTGTQARVNYSTGWYGFITADGFGVSLAVDNCDTNWVPGKTNYNINRICGYMLVDVNGFKGPNNMGRDIFEFLITNGKGPALYPYGGGEFADYYNQAWKNPTTGDMVSCFSGNPTGTSCAARIMEEGWQMKY